MEVTEVPEPNYLPRISIHHFEHYLNNVGQVWFILHRHYKMLSNY